MAEENHVIQETTPIIHLPLNKVLGSRQPLRSNIPREGINHLAGSIKEKGLLQPIVVRATQGDQFEVVMGDRRRLACAVAERQTIPAIVKDIDDDEALELSLIENLQREDLNPIDEAEGLRRLKHRRNMSDLALADLLSKSRVEINGTLAINRLPDQVKEVCRRTNRFGKEILMLIARQSTPRSQLALWRRVKSGELTVRETRAIAKRRRAKIERPRSIESAEPVPLSEEKFVQTLISTSRALKSQLLTLRAHRLSSLSRSPREILRKELRSIQVLLRPMLQRI